MNYVELEERLLKTLSDNHSQVDSETALELYRVVNSIDWVNLFQNPARSIEGLRNHLEERPAVSEIIQGLTTGMVLRYEAFQVNTSDHPDLLSVIIKSLEWRTSTDLLKDTVIDNIVLDVEEIDRILSSSPDLVIMYMLSNVNFLMYRRDQEPQSS